MRALIALASVVSLPAVAAEPRLDVGMGLMTTPRAASASTAPSFGLGASSPIYGVLQVRLDSQAARYGETNNTVRLSRWEWRSAVTADVVTSRQTVALRLGLGPSLAVRTVRVVGDDTYSGVRVVMGLRGHVGLSGRVAGPVGWRVGMGALYTADGMGWDGQLGMTWTPGGGA